ncbi:MAG: phage portal protein [Polyangiaceae bacterium]|nr:phage portal protein [Polyangiaceae bacterium]
MATQIIRKALVLGREKAPPNALIAPEEEMGTFSEAGAIDPPYLPRDLVKMCGESAAILPNIGAYAVNIECFGYRLEPTIDLDAADADQKIRDAIILEKIYDGEPAIVDEVVVEAKRIEIEAQMRLEKLQLDLFFEYACHDSSFIGLREKKRIDQEMTGNAYWEVIPDDGGRPGLLSHLPAVSTRLCPLDTQWLEVEVPQKISAIAYRKIKVKRRFRKYVQVINGAEAIYFKELDDPRTMSSRTGKIYESADMLAAAEPGAREATEVVHFAIYWPTSAYGVPRWIGTTPEILGSRAAAEVNLAYFSNKAIPPMAVLVSGGTLGQDSVERIESFLNDRVVGQENFHNVIVIEAEPAEGADGSARNNVKIELRPLMDAQLKDAIFLAYDAANTEKIGNSFRLPKLLRGDSADVNRATAEEAIGYAERQVFAPERNKDDDLINRRLFPRLGVRFWKFVSNGPVTRNPIELVDMVTKAVVANVITPREARELLKEAFQKEFKEIDEEWVDQPVAMLTGGAAPAMAGNPGVGQVGEQKAIAMQALATDLAKIKQRLIAAREQYVTGEADVARATDAVQTFKVSQEEMARLLGAAA